ncbi:serine aminopeptidase domain-containing protein [Eleftheria terrae]|uniref:serine aminopeptidase domain-containing protein n=1 Tax=Eleftheria terrae TaxID=1597781 RepID=UPI00263BB24D|nr:alpha/beta hydrolase [Eleftheria terrae]WKB53895.1 alpha/beta hydrolase [Eleftheria terrae]
MTEETIVFGPEQNLVGTFTAPRPGPAVRDDVMVLLSNAGVIPRIGPHRINVKLARHFATLGVTTFRFDTNGLGDSGRSASTLPVAEQFVADTRAAMDAAEARHGRRNFYMIGMCSGADIGHLTALEDARLKGVVLFDAYVYPTWKTGALRLLHRARNLGARGIARKLATRAAALLPGRRAAGAAAGLPAPAPRVAASVGIFGRSSVPAPAVFAERIHRLLARRVELFFIFSGGEPGAYNYRRQFHDSFQRFGFVDKVAYEWLPECDHVLTLPTSQQRFLETVSRWLQDRALAEGR